MGIPVPISAHNEPLVGDTLTTVQFNYEWRRLIVELLFTMCFDTFWTGAQADIEAAVNNAAAMIEDIYTEHPMQKLAARIKQVGGYFLLPAGVTTQVIFEDPALNAASYDFGGFFDAGNPSVVTIPPNRGGVYNFSATVNYIGSVIAGVRITTIRKNPNVIVGRNRETTDGKHQVSMSGDVSVVPGDTIVLLVFSEIAEVVYLEFSFHRVFN